MISLYIEYDEHRKVFTCSSGEDGQDFRSIDEVLALVQDQFSEAGRASLRDEVIDDLVKKVAVDFFRFWWNTGGTNTDSGFDEWWSTHSADYKRKP